MNIPEEKIKTLEIPFLAAIGLRSCDEWRGKFKTVGLAIFSYAGAYAAMLVDFSGYQSKQSIHRDSYG